MKGTSSAGTCKLAPFSGRASLVAVPNVSGRVGFQHPDSEGNCACRRFADAAGNQLDGTLPANRGDAQPGEALSAHANSVVAQGTDCRSNQPRVGVETKNPNGAIDCAVAGDAGRERRADRMSEDGGPTEDRVRRGEWGFVTTEAVGRRAGGRDTGGQHGSVQRGA